LIYPLTLSLSPHKGEGKGRDILLWRSRPIKKDVTFAYKSLVLKLKRPRGFLFDF